MIRSQSSPISGFSFSLSPSSSWIALICWRRKWSRWAFGQLAADLLLDLGRKLQDRELPRQVLPQPLEPGPHVDLAQQALLLLDRERQARGQQVGQPPRLARVDRRDLKLLGDLLALVDHPLKEPIHMVNQGVELDPCLDDLVARLDPADQVGLGLRDRRPAGPGIAPGRRSGSSHRGT